MNIKYYLLPLGCQMNKSDAERIETVLDKLGYVKTLDEKEADILGIVACSVRQKSINRVYGRIEKWNKWKNKKNIITFVSGCILEADRENFLKLFDIVFKINELPKLPEILRNYGVPTPISLKNVFSLKDYLTDFWKIEPKYSSSFQAYIPIQNGCNKFCSFCAVPYTRGREVSRNSNEILEEVTNLINKNYKSITLLGQNVNSYGKDKKGKEISFAELLEKIGQIGEKTNKEFWVYFTSPHPSDMSEEVIKIIKKYKCLANHIHLPLQSGDNEILKKMNRNYTIEKYIKLVNFIKKTLPDATIFTDIIVGFCGEKEKHFENTRKILKELRFNMAYIAMYSPRPGAQSYRWEDDVPLCEKKKRFHILTEDLKAVAEEENKKLIGKAVRVLVEGKAKKENYLAGKTEGLIPIHFPSQDKSLIGNFVNVKIETVTPFSLSGILIK